MKRNENELKEYRVYLNNLDRDDLYCEACEVWGFYEQVEFMCDDALIELCVDAFKYGDK